MLKQLKILQPWHHFCVLLVIMCISLRVISELCVISCLSVPRDVFAKIVQFLSQHLGILIQSLW